MMALLPLGPHTGYVCFLVRVPCAFWYVFRVLFQIIFLVCVAFSSTIRGERSIRARPGAQIAPARAKTGQQLERARAKMRESQDAGCVRAKARGAAKLPVDLGALAAATTLGAPASCRGVLQCRASTSVRMQPPADMAGHGDCRGAFAVSALGGEPWCGRRATTPPPQSPSEEHLTSTPSFVRLRISPVYSTVPATPRLPPNLE